MKKTPRPLPAPRTIPPVFYRQLSRPRYGDMPGLRAEMLVFLRKQRMPADDAGRFLFSLSEILNNLIEHPQHKPSAVSITLTLHARHTTLDVADNGTSFATFGENCRMSRRRMSAAQSLSVGGYGLACILRQHRRVCYMAAQDSADGFNHFMLQDLRAGDRA